MVSLVIPQPVPQASVVADTGAFGSAGSSISEEMFLNFIISDPTIAVAAENSPLSSIARRIGVMKHSHVPLKVL
ncbi:hypothetical protein BB560_003805 [Smittium megazygosporum]|uniref:Uncharacterized protein n=1 Tax=Smittium megazygosporum TaxID=133381 RepID=A0A2T9ZB26_9FUNG|nr:hypothetical protein BB560_003805 [Smittium megazygosporum]